MISLSTSFISGLIDDGESLVETLAGFEIDGIELEYRISSPTLEQMRLPLKQSVLKVSSIHNFCPIPGLTPPVKGSGDLFLLSSRDMEERRRAVQWTIRTIEQANDVEAPVVILHCGRVEISPELEQLYQYYHTEQIDSIEAQAFKQKKLDERDRHAPGHVDALLFALDRLMRHAEKHGVMLGLENRYHYHELPTLEVFHRLLTEFKGGPIGYWHDTGHAHANEILGIIAPGALPRGFEEQLIGMHWHDAVGLEDHLAPGQGEIDFNALKPYINKNMPIVIELKPGTASPKVKESIRFTREFLMPVTKNHDNIL